MRGEKGIFLKTKIFTFTLHRLRRRNLFTPLPPILRLWRQICLCPPLRIFSDFFVVAPSSIYFFVYLMTSPLTHISHRIWHIWPENPAKMPFSGKYRVFKLIFVPFGWIADKLYRVPFVTLFGYRAHNLYYFTVFLYDCIANICAPIAY